MFFKKGRFVTLQENGNTKIGLLIKGGHHVRGLKNLGFTKCLQKPGRSQPNTKLQRSCPVISSAHLIKF